MEKTLWIFIIVVMVISLIGSAFIVAYVLRRGRKHDAELGIGKPKTGACKSITAQGRKWNRIITIYLLLCFIFMVIILYQTVQGMHREAFDCLAVPVGAIFFLIQAFSTRRTAIRNERATAPAMAVFVKLEIGTQLKSGSRSYSSIFEFFANGTTHRVRYAGRLYKEEGAQVELYYAPDDPNVVYVPELEKAKSKFFPGILFLYGILFPLFGLLAPLLR